MRIDTDPGGLLDLGTLNLEPISDEVVKGPDDALVVRTIRGRVNRVQIGVAAPTDVSMLYEDGRDPAAEFNYVMVRLAVSFLPDRGCRISWARVHIELVGEGAAAGGNGRPVAFDLFPQSAAAGDTFARSVEFTGELKLAFARVAATQKQDRPISYRTRVVAAGTLTSTPSWTFDASGRAPLEGVSELYLLIQKPAGQTGHLDFTVLAEIETARWSMRYRSETALSRRFQF